MNLFARKKPEPERQRLAYVIGEALIDVVHRADGTIGEHPGGSPANVALTLGRLGRPAQLLTWIGEDAYGQLIRKWLSGSDVEIDPISTGAPSTSIATARLNERGAATYEFELEWLLPATASVPQDAVVVHSGSIAATLEPGATRVRDLMTGARERATLTYDPNVRPTLMGTPAEARAKIEPLVALADVIKVSDEDLEWLYPGRAADVSAAEWHEAHGALVVLTRGGAGATAWSANDIVEVAAPRVDVVDTVGAGDSFMGALIDGLFEADLLGGEKRDALRNISPQTTTHLLTACVRVAGITVSRAGANPPRRSELA